MVDSSKDARQGSANGRLKRDFFECSCEQLARKLLGQRLVRILADGRRLSGRIVETEAYVGAEDKAAHSYKGKRSARNEAMFMQPGTAYVYHIYGTYTCVNVSSQGEGHAVLIRALEPEEENIQQMKKHRGVKRADGGEGLKLTDIGSGPSKLTQAMSINRAEFDKEDLVSCKHLWLEEGSVGADEQVVATARVGIEKAEEWASKPLRFYLRGSSSVSVIDKKAELELQYQDAEPKKAKKRSHDEEVKESGSSSESDDDCAPSEAKQATLSADAGLGSAADRLKRDFFECSCEQLARKLLGQRLVRILADGRRLSGRIVETEAYVGAEDKAAHSYKGKRSARNEAMFMQPGTAYVYHIYGTYTCVNVSSQGEGHAVLIRAMEPEEGLYNMKQHRGVKRADGGKGLKLSDLGSGPSKLTQAMSINRAEFDKEDLVSCKHLWLEEGSVGADEQVVATARVVIEKAEEWASKPLRFYLRGSSSVSVIDKKAEAELDSK